MVKIDLQPSVQHLPMFCDIYRVGQNRIYTLYMTVNLMISLPKVTYIHRI